MSEIRSRNIQYFLLRTGDFGAETVLTDPAAWGLTLLDKVGAERLYRFGESTEAQRVVKASWGLPQRASSRKSSTQ